MFIDVDEYPGNGFTQIKQIKAGRNIDVLSSLAR